MARGFKGNEWISMSRYCWGSATKYSQSSRAKHFHQEWLLAGYSRIPFMGTAPLNPISPQIPPYSEEIPLILLRRNSRRYFIRWHGCKFSLLWSIPKILINWQRKLLVPAGYREFLLLGPLNIPSKVNSGFLAQSTTRGSHSIPWPLRSNSY